MRRWTLTLFLLGAAGVAVVLAPRLLAAVGIAPSVTEVEEPELHMSVIEEIVVETVLPEALPPRPPAPIPITRTPPHRPDPVPPRTYRPSDPSLLIPELDEQPHVDWSKVRPPEPDTDPTFWDDCPGCGMG